MGPASDLYAVHDHRELLHPVLIVAMDGWIDASFAARTALSHLLAASPTEPIATFDTEQLLDARARRPTVKIRDGVNEGLEWPAIELRAGTDASGKDVVYLVGPEPDFHWRAFCSSVSALAQRMGSELSVGLGSFPAPVPHTRPIRLAASATDAELAARIGFVAGEVQVPAGIGAAIEVALGQAGITAVGIWARVPHYIAGVPFPAAGAALVRGLMDISGLSFDPNAIDAAGEEARHQIDDMIAASEEHAALVRQLEGNVDSIEGNSLGLGPDVPSGDQIAVELERFLRGDGGQP
ncbi:MAG: proteasome assembly chaperone family protein [Acidimicrobiales bacterium]